MKYTSLMGICREWLFFPTCFLSLSEIFYETRRLFAVDCVIELRMDDYGLRRMEKRMKLQLTIIRVFAAD